MTFSNVRVSCRHESFSVPVLLCPSSLDSVFASILLTKRDLISYWSATVSEIEIEIRIQMMRNGLDSSRQSWLPFYPVMHPEIVLRHGDQNSSLEDWKTSWYS